MIVRALVGATVLAGAGLAGLAYRAASAPAPATRPVSTDRLPGAPGRPSLLLLTSPLCLACERTPGIVADALDLDEADLSEGRAPIGFAAVDVAEQPAVAEALEARSTPTIAAFDADGELAFVQEGNPTSDELADQLAHLEGVP